MNDKRSIRARPLRHLLPSTWMLALVVSTTVRTETIDRVLAVAAGQVIMLSDVTAAREFGWLTPARVETAPGAGDDPTDPIRATLSKLIDRQLMLAEVDRYAPPAPTNEAVDREVAAVRARFPSPPAFEAALAETGIDQAHVREIVRQNLLIRAYEDRRFAPENPRRQALIGEWVAGLRRRGDVVDLYGTGRQ